MECLLCTPPGAKSSPSSWCSGCTRVNHFVFLQSPSGGLDLPVAQPLPPCGGWPVRKSIGRNKAGLAGLALTITRSCSLQYSKEETNNPRRPFPRL